MFWGDRVSVIDEVHRVVLHDAALPRRPEVGIDRQVVDDRRRSEAVVEGEGVEMAGGVIARYRPGQGDLIVGEREGGDDRTAVGKRVSSCAGGVVVVVSLGSGVVVVVGGSVVVVVGGNVVDGSGRRSAATSSRS